MKNYLIILIICLSGYFIRMIYEILNFKKFKIIKNKAVIIIVFLSMAFLWISWFKLNELDPFKIVLPVWLKIFGMFVFLLGLLITFLGLIQFVYSKVQYKIKKSKDMLIKHGIYSFLRHPMYTGFILCIIGYPLFNNALLTLLLSVIFIPNIFLWKIFEEKQLLDIYPEYKDYCNKTSLKFLMHNKIIYYLFLFLMIYIIYLLTLYNFLLFHVFVELISIIIAFNIFIIAWNTMKYLRNSYLLFVGISLFFIALIDLIHTLTYKGMNIIQGYDANLPTQLWIIARYMQSITFFCALFFVNKKRIRVNLIFLIYTIITVISLYLVFIKIFPNCYIEGKGLTKFKIFSEYIISIIFIFSLVLFVKKKKYFNDIIFYQIFAAIIFTIISELVFTTYISVFGFSNILGHFAKLFAFYLLYSSIIKDGITNPFNMIFRELLINEEKLLNLSITDELTGLYNRRACFEFFKKIAHTIKRGKSQLTLCMIDLDNLKFVNDKYGHLEGDRMIKIISNGLKSLARESDYACRFGGDEFLMILPQCKKNDAEKFITRLKQYCYNITDQEKNKFKLEFSYGFAEYNGNDYFDINLMLEKADKALYKNKFKNKE